MQNTQAWHLTAQELPLLSFVATSSGTLSRLHTSSGTPCLSFGAGRYVERGCRDIYVHESPRALFKGLGPTLVGVVPARSINFFTYGNGKQVIANTFNGGAENSWVHLTAAAVAGIATGTATNPIWVVKTRLQLEASPSAASSSTSAPRSPFGGSVAMIRKIVREEGLRGLYKGLSASYLGVTETTIQWVLYERLKRLTARTEGRGGVMEWVGMIGSAGTAKCVASLITYPHEVRSYTLPPSHIRVTVSRTGPPYALAATSSRWEGQIHRPVADPSPCNC